MGHFQQSMRQGMMKNCIVSAHNRTTPREKIKISLDKTKNIFSKVQIWLELYVDIKIKAFLKNNTENK